jgi:hypothetical protein
MVANTYSPTRVGETTALFRQILQRFAAGEFEKCPYVSLPFHHLTASRAATVTPVRY